MNTVNAARAAEPELALGEAVLIAGRVVGRSEFMTGEEDSYMVEFDKGNGKQREWFLAGNLELDADVAA